MVASHWVYPAAWKAVKFQSPSLRGSGRFILFIVVIGLLVLFQSPSLRGSGRFRRVNWSGRLFPEVSIPFIAGQWSLPASVVALTFFVFLFQSPSLRGSGRFTFYSEQWGYIRLLFQSPSLRGSGRFPLKTLGLPVGIQVSIPFIAGQWSLRKTRSSYW